ncbi:MAG: MBL fold metallo-hydrolase [Dehalococcoidia bacterium]
MKVDNSSLNILSDGNFKVDGGSIFGQVPKPLWEQLAVPDRKNRITLGLNCLLVQHGDQHICVDTGVGTKLAERMKNRYGFGSSHLVRELRNRGLAPKDITAVILTHLHFDHSGGSTRLDRSGVAVATFPSATYYVQKAAWEEATNPNERAKSSYFCDDFLALEQKGQLCLLDGDAEIVPCVRVKVTGGHSRGHQMVLVNYGGERVAFLGDLIPTRHHLRLPYIASLDKYPEETLAAKRALLDEAERCGWLLIFSHGCEKRAGYLEKRNGELKFRAVDL